MRRALPRTMNRLLAPLGLRLVRDRETVVLPRPPAGPGRYPETGIDWNPERSTTLLTGALPSHLEEIAAFAPGAPPLGPHGYRSDNDFFRFADAAICWALLRERRPSVVVEVGSGHSSRLIRSALDANGPLAPGRPGEPGGPEPVAEPGRLVTIDPDPRLGLEGISHEHIPRPVQEVPLERFEALPEDAVLFIDSSHRAGPGSDVTRLFLEVLPALRPGVLIHVHDIFLPEDYPPSWNGERNLCYSEQYLLHALLLWSRGFRVVWPGRRMATERGEQLGRLLGAPEELAHHASFWLERRAVSPAEDAVSGATP